MADLPPAAEQEHDLRLVTVLQTEDTIALRLAEAALEDAGIEYLVRSDEALRQTFRGGFGLSPDMAPYQTCRIQVASDREAEARSILEPLEHPEPASDTEADLDE